MEQQIYPWEEGGKFHEANESPSRELISKAGQGDLDAQFEMSRYYKDDEKQRLAWLKKAAEGGNVRAQYEYGYEMSDTSNLAYDSEEAEKWFRAAAEKGWAPAQFELGDTLIRRLEWSDEDETEAIREGLEWVRKAVDARYAEAEALYGSLLLSGIEDILEKQESEAIPFLVRGAAASREAAYLLGKAYEEGLGVAKPDYSQAAEWYRQANKYCDSRTRLGMLYENGPHAEYGGPERNYRMAFLYYKEDLHCLHPEAYFLLGRLHMRGLGTPQNFIEAYVNFAVAVALSDNPPALQVEARDEAATKLGTTEMMKAQKRASSIAKKR